MAPLSSKSLIAIICVHLLLLLQLGVARTISSINGTILGKKVGKQREFDYFQLALQWPATYCKRTHHCCSSNACCRRFSIVRSGAPTHFTIHGLWPDYNDGTWPACCSETNFDEEKITPLVKDIQTYWPSLSCGSPSTCHGGKGSFWAHEWGKHGTCSYPVVGDEYSYFLTTLNIYFKHNVTNVLTEAGYVPSNTEKYPLGGIISAIENAFHQTPVLVCSNGALGELYLCFDKAFRLRDCAKSSKSSCPTYVSLPAVHVPEVVETVENLISSEAI